VHWQMCVNDLPRVAARQCGGRESNSRPVDSNVRRYHPSHLYIIGSQTLYNFVFFFQLPAVEQCAPNVSEVSLHHHHHHHKSVDDERQAAVKSSLLCAGDYSFTLPHRATYQTDSFLPVESGVVSSHSNNTAICISSQADNSGNSFASMENGSLWLFRRSCCFASSAV